MFLALGELYFEVSGECNVQLLIHGSTKVSAADREDQGSGMKSQRLGACFSGAGQVLNTWYGSCDS